MRGFAPWLLISHVARVYAQTTLSVPSQSQQQVTAEQSPLALSIPQSQTALNLSVALCSTTTPFPRFFVNNGSAITSPTIDDAGQELFLDGGVAFWNGTSPATFYAFTDSGSTGSRFFEVALSANETIFKRNSSTTPLFGDSTSTQAILFSAPFLTVPKDEPSYPYYTLPSANLSSDAPSPPTPPQQTLLVYPTSNLTSSLVPQLNQSFCGMLEIPGNLAGRGKLLTQSVVLRDADGWRTQWIIEDLQPSTNYSAFIVQDTQTVSPPLYFTTKSASFACSLVHSLPYCPAVAYSVPLSPPTKPSTTYFAQNIPSNITDPLISSIANFSTSVLTFACGRDIYSSISSCADCQAAYRAWACAVSFPRCGEAPSNGISPPPALVSYNGTSPSRNMIYGEIGRPYQELLPCVETCYGVQRACPSFLGWQCPVYEVNANESYGIGYIDGPTKPRRGHPGMAQDSFGNVFCNQP